MKNPLIYYLIFVSTTLQAQIVNVPDPNFKNALVNDNVALLYSEPGMPPQDVDTNDDGEIQISEALDVWRIDLDFKNISSLQGIEEFIEIEWLLCYQNEISTLDISNNVKLEFLVLSFNEITQIDVSQNINLEVLRLGHNQLSQLDVTNNQNLIELSCGNNELSSLDVSQNINLSTLLCGFNELDYLDIQQNVNLINLWCSTNQLENLDISNNLDLVNLSCDFNQLTTLDVSQHSNLQDLWCRGNKLIELNLKNGNNVNLDSMLADLNPDLYCISVDDIEYANTAEDWFIDSQSYYSESCKLGAESFKDSEFVVFPNPVRNVLSIGSPSDIQHYVIEVYSTKGELLLSTAKSEINVSNFPSGIYYIKISTDEHFTVKKFMKS
ncbi:T9SS type A sorting domain-containing protein [Aureisphaera galaxeae]|uniref:T9SS type A sorting domain-containing protein n=1 Tax=Aureisphaera galaxeae TaxID=1538023 RepID=UPI0023509217|nr:T9SS type A sorting domain-containing protein [Aureisphaera galaxeae]MDC8002593.1 T9SS type A sorting domain-containing protein [Aureisphaera galaxeae]